MEKFSDLVEVQVEAIWKISKIQDFQRDLSRFCVARLWVEEIDGFFDFREI